MRVVIKMNIFNCKIVLNITHGCGTIVRDRIRDSNVPDTSVTCLYSVHKRCTTEICLRKHGSIF